VFSGEQGGERKWSAQQDKETSKRGKDVQDNSDIIGKKRRLAVTSKRGKEDRISYSAGKE